MLKQFNLKLLQILWKGCFQHTRQATVLQAVLNKININYFPIDHFAIIDLPSKHSGIQTLTTLFELIDFTPQGKGYLPQKQNDFLWLAEKDASQLPAEQVLPQIVVADFRLDEMPSEIKKIIYYYASYITPLSYPTIQKQINQLTSGDKLSFAKLLFFFTSYLKGREWPLPTFNEYVAVKEFNELLAWVLIFGRRPNHFTLAIHLLKKFFSLEDFHIFLLENTSLSLNKEGGIIKGGKQVGIEQSSTIGALKKIKLQNKVINIPKNFIEFVYRYSQKDHPHLWKDYFTGFVASHANDVIESLSASKTILAN